MEWKKYSTFLARRYAYLLTYGYVFWLLGAPLLYAQSDLHIVPLVKNRKADGVLFYNMLEDQQGYLWLGSDCGVFRYDGTNFDNYTIDDGLLTNEVLDLYEDRKGHIWQLTYQKGVSFYDKKKNEIIIPPWNDTLTQKLGTSWIQDMVCLSNGTVWLQEYYPFQATHLRIYRIKEEEVTRYQIRTKPQFDSLLTTITLVEDEEQELFFDKIRYRLNEVPHIRSLHLFGDSILVKNKSGFVIKEDLNEEVLDTIYGDFSRVKGYRQLNCGSIAQISEKGIVLDWSERTARRLLSNYVINDIHQLTDGQVVFSTNRQGLLLSNSLAIQREQILEPNEIVEAMTHEEGKLYIKTNKGIFQKREGGYELITEISENIILPNQIQVFIKWKDYFLVRNHYYQNYKKKRYNLGGHIKSMNILEDHTIMVSTSFGIIRLNDQIKKIWSSQEIGYNEWVNFTTQVNDTTCWLGTTRGIGVYNLKQNKMEPSIEGSDNYTIVNIQGNTDKTIFVTTQSHGVFIYSGQENEPIRVDLDQGIGSNYVNDLLLVNDTTAWVATNNGISRIDFLPSLRKYTLSRYLTNGVVNDLVCYQDTIYAIVDQKMVSFSTNLLALPVVKANFFISKVSVNGQLYPLEGNELILEPDQNQIQITFTNINFGVREPEVFEYALLSTNSLDTVWYETSNYTLNYFNLPAGEYKVLIRKKKEGGTLIRQLSIQIKPYFTQTVYFQLLLYIVLITVIGSIAWIVISVQKRRNNLQRLLVNSQLKLLRTQMNPHFIFNALNSILGYVTLQDVDKSATYLSSFANLIRRVLENSKYSFLPLRAELEMLTIYIDLEKMRLGSAYEIEVMVTEDSILDAFYIPPMLIQPLIENSILHGVTPNEEGVIEVIVKKVGEDRIEIIVEDNGVGRKASRKKSKWMRNKKSIGIQNIKERIEVINETYKVDLHFRIRDKYDETGAPTGTIAYINLPKFVYQADNT
jgi:signal transduction histidine kinase